jgi:hypothetical protein
MTIGKSLAKMNRGTTIAFIVPLVWIVFFHSTSCNAFVLGVQALRNPKMLNKIDSFSFETISKNGNSHTIDEMISSALNPATHTTSLFLLQDKDNSEITTPSLLLPFDQNNSAIMTATQTSLFLIRDKDNSEIVTPSLLFPFNQDNSAITTATHAQNLLLASSFDDKSSATFKLVVASLRNEYFKCQTNDSPAKQRPVSNDNPAIDISLQLCVPMIPTVSATLTTKLTHILAFTTALNGQNLLLLCVQDDPANRIAMATCIKLLLLHCVRDNPAIMMATHAKPKLHLIVAFIRRASTAQTTVYLISVSEGEHQVTKLHQVIQVKFRCAIHQGIQAKLRRTIQVKFCRVTLPSDSSTTPSSHSSHL